MTARLACALAAFTAALSGAAEDRAEPDLIETTAIPLTITLADEVFVKGPQLTLGELAALDGSGSDELAALEIGPAPRPGATATLQAALIETRIRNAGLDGDGVVVKGARMIKATTLSQEILGVDLGDSLRTHILAELPWEPENALVEVAAPTYDVVVPEGDMEIRWVKNPTYNYIGATAFKGEVFVDGALQRTVQARAHVQVFTDVLVAATDIPRGAVVSGNHLVLEKRALADLPHGTIGDPAAAVGMVARSTIFPGTVLTTRKLDTPIAVRRNQKVVVETRSGGLIARGNAVAKQDGRVGEQIQCQNPETKEIIFGLVRRDGVVEVQ